MHESWYVLAGFYQGNAYVLELNSTYAVCCWGLICYVGVSAGGLPFTVLYCVDAQARRNGPHGGVPQIGPLRRA